MIDDLQKLIQLVLEIVPVAGTSVSEPNERRIGVSLHPHGPVPQARVAPYERGLLLQLRGVVVQGLVEHPEHESPVEGHSGREEGHKDDESDPAADAAATEFFRFCVPAKEASLVKVFFLLLHFEIINSF